MKTALLIIDVQAAAVREHTKHIPAMIEKLQQKYQNIFVSRFVNKDSPLIKLTGWGGYNNEDLVFTPAKTAKVFNKNIYSSFILDLREFDEVHLCGFDTDACIYKTALDLIENNIRPVVLSKFCGSSTQKLHQDALFLLARNIGKDNIA